MTTHPNSSEQHADEHGGTAAAGRAPHGDAHNTGWKRLVNRLIVSQGISLVGSEIVQYALYWYIVIHQRTGASVALATLTLVLPLVLLSPIAGVWADRFDRRILTVASDAITAITTVGIMLMFITGHDDPWVIYLAMFLRACSSAVQGPALTALLPTFVPSESLTKVNGALGSMQGLKQVLGPALGGAVLAIWPLYSVFLIDIVTAIIGIAIFWFGVRVPGRPPHNPEPTHWASDLREGVRYVRRSEFFRTFFLLFGIFLCLAAAPIILPSLHVVRSFGPETWRLSIMEACFGIGGMLGGAIMAVWGGLKDRMNSGVIGLAILGLGSIAVATAPGYTFIVIAMLATGFGIPMANSPMFAEIQIRCDPTKLGKVTSLMLMLNGVSIPIGALVFGPLADAIPTPFILAAAGIGQLTIAACIWRHPKLHRPEPSSAPA